MATDTPSQARVDAARAWHKKQGHDAPAWEDVELVARLGVVDESVARRILFDNIDALLSKWTDLQRVLSVAAIPAAAGPPAASSEPTPPHSQPGLTGIVKERVQALGAWLKDARAEGRELEGLSIDDLTRIAEIGPTDTRVFKQFHPGARNNAKELLGVLQRVANDSSASTATPTALPTREVRASDLTPAAGSTSSTSSPAAPTNGGRARGAASTVGFADFDYTTDAAKPKQTPSKISFLAVGDESLQMTWPTPDEDGLVRIFRVVTNNTYPPVASPLLGEVISATFDAQATDSREFTSPVRHVAIWMNEAATEQAARGAQPTLYAAGGCVLPVRHCEVREDEGTVIGQWEAIDGVVRVDVLRVPIDQAAQHQHYDHQFRLPPASVGKGGFTDHGALPGEEYEYRIYAVAVVSGIEEELSPYVARTVRLQAVVQSVTDLVVKESLETADAYDLQWTMPQMGTVEIYRGESPPAAGIDQHVLDRATLIRQGLTPDLRLAWQLSREGARGGMNNVPWPKGWSRAYFTPVTILNEEQMRVGVHEILTRSSPVSHVRLIERVDEQFLTFAWPAGVTMVKLYQGPLGNKIVDPEKEYAIHELSEEEYAKYGGAHLKHRLPAEGCAVHIVGTSYARGKAVHSTPVTIEYEGLARLSYDLVPMSDGGRRNRDQGTLRRLVVQSDIAPENVPLVLVHNAERLPLYTMDGQEILRRTMSFAPGVSQVVAEQIDFGGRSGFMRLFVDVPPHMGHRLAVLDPAVDHLKCGG